MKDKLREYKREIIISSLFTLLPVIFGIILWEKLPSKALIHWSADGVGDNVAGKVFTVFGLPVIFLLSNLFCVFATLKDPKNEGQSKKGMNMIFYILPLCSIVSSGVIYSSALGKAFSTLNLITALTGLMFTVFGNYFPKLKQNMTVGIKTPWAVANEDNWNKTHRFGGKLWFFGGVIIILSIFLPKDFSVSIMIGMIFVLAFVPMIYSYLYYKKQKKEDTYEDKYISSNASLHSAKQRKASLLFTAVIFIFVIFMLFTGNIEYELNDTSFTINADYWSDLTVNYDDIDEISLIKEFDGGIRTGGFGSERLCMGNFNNDEFGDYMRYTYTKCEYAIMLVKDGEVLVIGRKTEAETEALFKEIEGRIK